MELDEKGAEIVHRTPQERRSATAVASQSGPAAARSKIGSPLGSGDPMRNALVRIGLFRVGRTAPDCLLLIMHERLPKQSMLFERDGKFARAKMLRSRDYKESGWSSHINSLAKKHRTWLRLSCHAKGRVRGGQSDLVRCQPRGQHHCREGGGRANSVGATSLALRATEPIVLTCRKQTKTEVGIAQPD